MQEEEETEEEEEGEDNIKMNIYSLLEGGVLILLLEDILRILLFAGGFSFPLVSSFSFSSSPSSRARRSSMKLRPSDDSPSPSSHRCSL